MSSHYLERSYSDLPPRYMSTFTDCVDKCITEWDYIHGVEKPRFATMVFSTVLEEMFILLNDGSHITYPVFIPKFNDLVEEHNIFKISPFAPDVNQAALVALQAVWLLDPREFSMYTDFWETLFMDIIGSVVYVSTTNRNRK